MSDVVDVHRQPLTPYTLQVGYLACVLLLSETNEFLRLIINSTKNDLSSQNQEIQALALACIANVGGREFAETLSSDVQKILLSQHSHATVRKKAALCMLRLLRKYPEAFGEDGISNVPGHRDQLIDLLVRIEPPKWFMPVAEGGGWPLHLHATCVLCTHDD